MAELPFLVLFFGCKRRSSCIPLIMLLLFDSLPGLQLWHYFSSDSLLFSSDGSPYWRHKLFAFRPDSNQAGCSPLLALKWPREKKET
ncbi:hypothetical protein ACQKWADRAFT_63893 [Trichoderma austrokoningii]